MQKVYFDNAATTKMHPKVKEKVLPFLADHFGNPSSIHSFGRHVRVAIEEAREVVADFLNADASEIYFTSGGTESNNFSIKGIAKTVFEEDGRNKVITSKADHHAVLDTVIKLSEDGFITEALDTDESGRLTSEKFQGHASNDLSLLAVIHVNNETGSINDIYTLTKIIKSVNAYLHVDAVQSYGKYKIDVSNLSIDTLAASGHKIYGLKGTGILFARSGTPISNLIIGGPQERNRRGGTENVPGIIAFAEATKLAKENMEQNYSIVSGLKNYFINLLNDNFADRIKINSSSDDSPYILSVTFRSEFFRNDAESMLMYMDLNGIAASNGAACTSGTLKPSHVLEAMGIHKNDANGTIRFSFNPENTNQEIDYCVDVLIKMAEKFKK